MLERVSARLLCASFPACLTMRCLVLATSVSVASGIALAQAAGSLGYDVVSVKANKLGAYTSSVQFDSGAMLKADNANVMMMVCDAYDLPQYLVEGLPDWGSSEHFDVNGKIVDATAEQINALSMTERRAMLATVLRDRFGLKAHWETRIKPEYALVIAKGGSKLKESQQQQRTNVVGWKSLDAKSIRTDDLAKDLQGRVNKPVVDKTGLTGKYDVYLTWSVEGQTLNGGDATDETAQAPIFTAVKESLGLELKPIHGPVQVLLVDAIARPSSN